jgi:hypothetical protein
MPPTSAVWPWSTPVCAISGTELCLRPDLAGKIRGRPAFVGGRRWVGWRPHTVKGPEIGRHPNPSPADEFCWNSKVGRRIQGVVEVGLAAVAVLRHRQVSGSQILTPCMLFSGVGWGWAGDSLAPTVAYRTDSLCKGDYRSTSGCPMKSLCHNGLPSAGLPLNPTFVVR